MNRKTQVIDADSWHGKIYLRVLAMIDIFIGQSSESKHYAFKRYSDYFGRRTSFCHYWRMIAVYSWLVPLCYIATAAMVVNAFIIFPIQHFGWFGPLWLIGIPLAGCAIVCGCIILFVMVIEAVDDLTQDVPGALMD